MGLLQTIRQWRDARRERKADERTERLAQQIVMPARMRDFYGMKELLDKYRHSPAVVRSMTEKLAGTDLIRTPEDAAKKSVTAMMESLKGSENQLKQ